MPSPTLLRFPFVRTAAVLPHRVYWKAKWGDTWVQDETLHCSSATWCANPTIPTATLTRRYGQALRPQTTVPATVRRIEDKERYLIKIEFDTVSILGTSNPPATKWYGVLEIDTDTIDGALSAASGNAIASGRQFFQCFGLGFMLDRIVIANSMALIGSDEKRLGRGLDFNFNGRPNRTTSTGAMGTYLFSAKLKEADRAWWSTRDAVDYLLNFHGPVTNTDTIALPFALKDDDSALPTWDHVNLPTEGQSTWELLNSLVSRQRLLGFKLEPSADESKINLIPFTFAGSDITLPEVSGGTVTANANQIKIACERAADAEIVVKRSSMDAYDQVLVIGARRTSTCTLSFIDANIQKGWTDDLETEYEAGASTAGDYPAAEEIPDRIRRNVEARSSEKFKSVFSYFTLIDDWDGKAGGGIGGDKYPVFPSDADPTVNATIYPPELFVLPRLRLEDGYDYTASYIEFGSVVELSPGPHERLHPVVLFPGFGAADPPDKWRTVEDFGINADLEEFGATDGAFWSARVEVPEDARGLLIRLTQGPQFLIAKTDFDGLDVDPAFNDNDPDYYKALFTVCLEWDYHAQGIYPTTVATATDELRTLTLNLGHKFRCDYVVPNTVYGVKPQTGEPLFSLTGGYVRDDRPILAAMARMAYEWYATIRKAITFKSSRPTSELFIGQFLASIGDPAITGDFVLEDINSVITSCEIEIPYAEGEGNIDVGPAKLTYETSFGELDQIKFVSTFAVR